MIINDPLTLAITAMLCGMFIGACCAIIGFMIHIDLHYTDAEITELCDMYGITRNGDKYDAKH